MTINESEKKAEIFSKISDAQKGREFSEEHLSNLRSAHFARRGRSPKLTKPLPQTKLTPKQVVEIRVSYAAGESCGSIAKRYGLSVKGIYSAAVGKTHKQIGGAVKSARFGTDEWRENISKANRHRKFSPEHLVHLRAALKLRDERCRG